jgi:hypothetical protein
MVNVTSSTLEKVPLKYEPKDLDGNLRKVEGAPLLTITSGGATAQQATDEDLANGIGGWLVSENVPGTSTWEMKADADLSANIREITENGDYSYGDPQAETLGVTAGTPVLK